MSFNRRGPDRRPDRPARDRYDRPPRRESGDWQPRERPSGGDRPYQPRGDRPYQQRGGDRPYTPRPRPDPRDEGAMSIRLDPRRLGTLKHLAGEAGVRPGDLVRQWVEERIDASRNGVEPGPAAESIAGRLEELVARVAALEAASGMGTPGGSPPEPVEEQSAPSADAEQRPRRARRNAVSAGPSERVALHDEMIAVLAERGPMSAGDLAAAITERGRYAPPRSGKAIDAATVSQRASNPTYRSRFVRNEGRIGLAE